MVHDVRQLVLDPSELRGRRECRKEAYLLLKRPMDLLLAVVLLAGLLPLLLAIALAVVLDSHGPAFYVAERVGKGGRPFRMFKFRTMVARADASVHKAHMERLIRENLSAEDEPGCGLKLANDPRVTRLGAVLRKTSLDELPQLLNVLRGEMSLVGPRPPLPYEVEMYEDWHKQRLQATPGITGLWQVRGRNMVSFDEMVHMDLDYIARQSPWLDLFILAATPVAVIRARGAG